LNNPPIHPEQDNVQIPQCANIVLLDRFVSESIARCFAEPLCLFVPVSSSPQELHEPHRQADFIQNLHQRIERDLFERGADEIRAEKPVSAIPFLIDSFLEHLAKVIEKTWNSFIIVSGSFQINIPSAIFLTYSI